MVLALLALIDSVIWHVIIHLTFVCSAVLMGVLDRMSFAARRDH